MHNTTNVDGNRRMAIENPVRRRLAARYPGGVRP